MLGGNQSEDLTPNMRRDDPQPDARSVCVGGRYS